MSPAEPLRVLGYYSISAGAIAFARVPADLTRRLGRYDVPVFRLGRLAVDLSVQRRGLGGEAAKVSQAFATTGGAPSWSCRGASHRSTSASTAS